MGALFNQDAISRIRLPTGQYLDLSSSGWGISIWFNQTGHFSTNSYLFHTSGLALSGPNLASIRITGSTNITNVFSDYRTPQGGDTNITSSHALAQSNPLFNSGWMHLVWSRSRDYPGTTGGITNAMGTFYVNGQLVATNTQTGLVNATGVNLILGRRGDTGTSTTFAGILAEFAKFDGPISPTQAQQLYRGHDPELMGARSYLPLRNDFVDRITGFTGVPQGVVLTGDHPIPDKYYYPINDLQNTLPQLDGRVGQLEGRGFIDFIDWIPGGVPPSGISQTGAFFSQAKLGDGYVVAPNRSLSGCTVQAYASGGAGTNSGTLQMIVTNMTPLPIDLSGQIRFNIYRL